jgi:hypothetical protein
MPTVNETPRAEAWLFQTLAAAIPTVTAYSAIAPEGVAHPFIVYSQQSPTDLMGVGPARIWASFLYLVKVSDQISSYMPLKATADAIDAALHGASGTVPDGAVLDCIRERAFSLTEVANGVEWRHLGGLYRLKVQPR